MPGLSIDSQQLKFTGIYMICTYMSIGHGKPRNTKHKIIEKKYSSYRVDQSIGSLSKKDE